MDDIQKINMSLFNTIKPDQDNAIKIMRSGQEKTRTFQIK